jgi:hypothetical protein
MSRFVLLYHECPPDYDRVSHWDLMLESGEVLRTWALAELPKSWQTDRSRAAAVGDAVKATELADHRLAYLDYEGPVSGERGTVRRVDAGTFKMIVDGSDRLEIELNGASLQGRLSLHRHKDANWILTLESSD